MASKFSIHTSRMFSDVKQMKSQLGYCCQSIQKYWFNIDQKRGQQRKETAQRRSTDTKGESNEPFQDRHARHTIDHDAIVTNIKS